VVVAPSISASKGGLCSVSPNCQGVLLRELWKIFQHRRLRHRSAAWFLLPNSPHPPGIHDVLIHQPLGVGAVHGVGLVDVVVPAWCCRFAGLYL